jgi:O-antigen ligase
MNRRTIITLSTFVGGLAGAALGICFGAFVMPLMGLNDAVLKDSEAAGILFGWIGLIVGGLIGNRRGSTIYRNRKRREYYAARQERYASQLEAYEAEKGTKSAADEEWEAVERLPKRKSDKSKDGFESPWP